MSLNTIHMEDLSVENNDEVVENIQNQNSAHLNEFFKKYFQYRRKLKHDGYTKIKDNEMIAIADLPSGISEHFIFYKSGPWYWTYPNSAKDYLFKIYNIQIKRLTSNNPQKLIFDFYNKWVFSLEKNDSKYFALSVIKQIKNARKNALNLILHATILAYDKILFNPPEALQQLEEAENALLAKDLDELESMELRYVIKLFKGFIYLKTGEFDNAKQYFEEALNYKDNGVSAMFHLAISDTRLGNIQQAQDLTAKAYQFDLGTMRFGLDVNSTQLFEVFLENSVCSYFFSDKYSYELLPVFERSVNDLVSSGQVRFDKLKEDLQAFRENKWYRDKGELVESNVNFIDLFIKQFGKSENIFVLEMISKLEQKFVDSINRILQSIEEGFQEKINKQLKIYDVKLVEDEELKKRLTADLEKSKQRLEDKREATVKNFNITMDEKVKIAEDRLKQLEHSMELNPANSFKNSMMYSVMLSVMVLLMGGFAEYSNVSSSGFGQLLSVVIVSGSKWGLLTFVVGMIIAVFMSVSTSLEKNRVRQRLTKDVGSLKDEKQRGIKRINGDSKLAAQKLEERTNKKIESLNEQIAELKEKKKEDEEHLRESYSSKLKVETIKLSELAAHY